MVTKHMYSIYIYNSLLVNASVSLIVGEVLPHMTRPSVLGVFGLSRPNMVAASVHYKSLYNLSETDAMMQPNSATKQGVFITIFVVLE